MQKVLQHIFQLPSPPPPARLSPAAHFWRRLTHVPVKRKDVSEVWAAEANGGRLGNRSRRVKKLKLSQERRPWE